MILTLLLAALPHVHLLATGGTIAGGRGGSLDARELTALVPGLSEVASLTLEDVSSIGSSRMTPEIQLKLAKRVNEVFATDKELAGIVITHGTDSLEETAFFVDLLLDQERPVVFAAAQRPPREVDSDGPRNLLNAVRIATSAGARGMGVLVTLNGELHAARDVRKTHAVALDAFKSPEAGPVGYVDGASVHFTRKPTRRLHVKTDSVEARVDLLTLVAGSDGHLLRAAVDTGAQGIVLEVFGRGNVPPAVMDQVRYAREKGVLVAFTTRTRGGRVEISEEARDIGVLSGEDLDGIKARTLLVVALGQTRDRALLQSYFGRLSGMEESMLLDPTSPEMNREAPPTFRVRFETTAGDFVVDVNRDWAPLGARRFYNLVRNGFYDDTRFFRVVAGRWAQFGIHGDPEVATRWRHEAIPDDPVRQSNLRGSIAFASGGPNDRTTQIYINLGDNSAQLDPRGEGFAPFGRIVEGIDVIDRLNSGYGDSAGGGIRAGRQDPLFTGGNVYLDAKFPGLDSVKTVRIVSEAR